MNRQHVFRLNHDDWCGR